MMTNDDLGHHSSFSCHIADSSDVALTQLLVLVRDRRWGLSALTSDVDDKRRLMSSFSIWLPCHCQQHGTWWGLIHSVMWHGCIIVEWWCGVHLLLAMLECAVVVGYNRWQLGVVVGVGDSDEAVTVGGHCGWWWLWESRVVWRLICTFNSRTQLSEHAQLSLSVQLFDANCAQLSTTLASSNLPVLFVLVP